MASSNLSPPTRMDLLQTTPPKDITAISVVPPPISTTILPLGSEISIPAPNAAATGSSIKYASFAPAARDACFTARSSTLVTPEGIHTITRGFTKDFFLLALLMKYFSIFSVTSYSAMTPSRNGRIATMLPGVRPNISRASVPTAITRFVLLSIATTEGSFNTIPSLFT